MLGKFNLAAVAAMAMVGAAGAADVTKSVFGGSVKKLPKVYKTMVVSTREEIAAWNRSVHTRQVQRRIDRPWKNAWVR